MADLFLPSYAGKRLLLPGARPWVPPAGVTCDPGKPYGGGVWINGGFEKFTPWVPPLERGPAAGNSATAAPAQATPRPADPPPDPELDRRLRKVHGMDQAGVLNWLHRAW